MDVSALFDGIKIIDGYKELVSLVDHLLKFKELAVDIEFDDFKKQIGKTMSIIQIYDGKTAYIIDVKQIKNIDIISKIFNNKDIIKVFHSCDSDLSFLSKYHIKIQNIIDTDILNKKLLSIVDNISLKNLLKRELDIDIDKTEQKSDWLKRPLSYAQIVYAATDVKHLIELKNILTKKLEELNISYSQDEVKTDKEEYKFEKLESFLNRLCKEYKERQVNILRKDMLFLLLDKRIYEKQYLMTLFKDHKYLPNHIDELSIILHQIIYPGRDFHPKKDSNIKSHIPIPDGISPEELIYDDTIKVGDIKREIIGIFKEFNKYYKRYSRDDVRGFSYIGFKGDDEDLFNFLEENNINKIFVTDGAVAALKNKTKKFKDETRAV